MFLITSVMVCNFSTPDLKQFDYQQCLVVGTIIIDDITNTTKYHTNTNENKNIQMVAVACHISYNSHNNLCVMRES